MTIDYTKIDDAILLIKNEYSVHNNSNAFSDQKMIKTLNSIQHGLPIPNAIEGDSIVKIDSFGTTKMSSVDHNSNSLCYLVSDKK